MSMLGEQQLRALIPPPPAPLTSEQPAWGADSWAPSSSMDATRRIFCNRSLNMAHIKAIGASALTPASSVATY